MAIDPISNSGPEVSIGVAADVYRIAKEEIPGGRYLVPAVLSLLFFWGTWRLIGWVYADVEPVVSSLASSGGQLSLRWQDFASAALTLAAVGGVYFLFTRRISKWQYNVMDSLSDALDNRFATFPSATDLSELATRVKEIEKVLKIGPQRRQFERLDAIFTGTPSSQFNYAAAAVLTITQARYGFGNRWMDVTEVVESLIVEKQRLEFKVTNATLGGDPCPDQVKQLEVNYSINGLPKERRVWQEKDTCQLP